MLRQCRRFRSNVPGAKRGFSVSRFTQLKAFTALEARNFRLYFFGQCCALTGTWMQRLALTWLVLVLTGSGAKMGLVEFLNQCPVFCARRPFHRRVSRPVRPARRAHGHADRHDPALPGHRLYAVYRHRDVHRDTFPQLFAWHYNRRGHAREASQHNADDRPPEPVAERAFPAIGQF
ncbi:hypothetical protein KL86DPRO_60013 [uncultured delta proteobacterium]|uniref:Uncharacterized protein n=1 Tax=uncultured delta proteobacterium TaxID=34034 RepID=A0A212KEV0_9DELT|nr:hypothetical protein KL86DPRO_60013 [uncultured delta proteobacterium]